jgi:hypothetical protein
MNTATRQRIVMTALELFYVKGYNSTSISDILSRRVLLVRVELELLELQVQRVQRVRVVLQVLLV